MKKYYTLGKSPKILIVEGFWGVGKSRLIAQILHRWKINHIPEPNHIEAGISKNLSEWYRSEHNKRLELARKHLKSGKNVILERSTLSSLAFHYAKYAKIPTWFNRSVSYFQKEFPNLYVFFLRDNKKTNLDRALNTQDNAVRSLILRDNKFYDKYIFFYTSILPSLVHIKIVRICVSKSLKRVLKTGKKEAGNLSFSDFFAQHKHKKMKRVLCASVVLFYKKKFLVLYSHDYHYYVLPQGHKATQEKYTDTALRETREETGFFDLKIIAPLSKYRYQYNKNNISIDKHIQVYLVQLKTLARRKKQLESHEHYSNHFFTAGKAIKKLQWPEDKKMILRAEKIISKIKKSPNPEGRGLR